MTPVSITRIVRICRNVATLEASVAFYEDRLGFRSTGPPGTMEPVLAAALGFAARAIRVQRLTLGKQELELVEAGPNARPYPPQHTSADLDFQHIAVRCLDIGTAFEQLHRQDSRSAWPMAISHRPDLRPAPIRLPDSSGGVTAFKFRDPDRHPVELLQPAGNERTRSTGYPGIDHTAISVSSAPAGIAFYRDALGMSVSAYQTNSGDEQGSLDALESPIVDVVSLQTTSGLSPHLELLAYRRPAAPRCHEQAEAADIVSDRIVICCSDVGLIARNLGMACQRFRFASGEPCLLFRDPDGHILEATERLP